jgi:predicted MPP superfamily phosphohydrolase
MLNLREMGGNTMKSDEITFTSFQAKYHTPVLTKSVKKETGFFTLLFRYALPFILFDMITVGIALLLYLGPKFAYVFSGMEFFLYGTSVALLAGLHKGFRFRRSRLFIVLYIALILFSLGEVALAVLIKIGGASVLQWVFWRFLWPVIAVIGCVTAFTNFILLPLLNIGMVLWQKAASTIEVCLPRIFPGVNRMNLRERILRSSCSVLMISGVGYSILIEPNMLRVEEIEIVSDKVAEDVTILHLTDMHIDAIGYHEQKLFRCIQELDPDIILQTGDLLDLYHPEEWDIELMNDLADLFRQLSPKYGTTWIVGNHDYGLEKIDWFYERAGVRLLHDAEWLIADDFGRLRLLGLSWLTSRWVRDKGFIENWLKHAEKDDFTIVMGHAPDYILDIVDLNIDLALAGHLHGGQMGIPGLQKLLLTAVLQELGSDFPPEWAAGYRELENIRINVSVGTGSHGSTRVFCPPTMTLFTVKKL